MNASIKCSSLDSMNPAEETETLPPEALVALAEPPAPRPAVVEPTMAGEDNVCVLFTALLMAAVVC